MISSDTLSQRERDNLAYTLARQYLLSLDSITVDVLDRHLDPDEKYSRPRNMPGVYEHLLWSAQNRGMSPSVIGASIGGVDRLGEVLFGFQPSRVVETYHSDWESLLDTIINELGPSGEIRRTPKSLWPQYCRSILSGASFLTQFETARDFYDWVHLFDGNHRARPALPMLLSYEIHGFGFALACDFLKELGFESFSKPDVHLRKILPALKLSLSEDDLDVFKAIGRIARNVGVTPYTVDKLFWLCGSGDFYREGIDVGTQKDSFIAYAQREMEMSRG